METAESHNTLHPAQLRPHKNRPEVVSKQRARMQRGRTPAPRYLKREQCPSPVLPRDVRQPLFLDAVLIMAGGSYPVNIHNLSLRGLGGICSVSPPIATRVAIILPVAGSVDASIQWAVGQRFGARLVRRLDCLEQILAQSPR